MPLHSIQRKPHAFTLVEVAISLGIVSMVLVSLIGLVASGLTNFRTATGYMVESQIVEGVANNLAMESFSGLQDAQTQGTPRISYYDNSGTKLPAEAGWSYRATATLLPVDAGSTPIAFATAAAFKVHIAIEHVTELSSTASEPRGYSFIVANNGL